jgi:hypothetical protein
MGNTGTPCLYQFTQQAAQAPGTPLLMPMQLVLALTSSIMIMLAPAWWPSNFSLKTALCSLYFFIKKLIFH